MAGNKEVNSNLQIKGKINLKDVPNNTPTGFLVWNSEIKDIAQRTSAQLLTDLNLITATNIAANYYTKPQVDTNIKTAVDDILIGGLNLIVDSEKPTWYPNDTGLGISIKMEDSTGKFTRTTPSAGKNVSVFGHFIEDFVSGQFSRSMYFRHFHTSNITIWGQSIAPDKWVQVKDEAYFNYNGHNGYSIDVPNIAIDTKKLKVEKGNKATDYSPNPLDQVTDWNTTDINDLSFLKNKPTKLSQFTNDSGYLTSSALSPYAQTSWVNANFDKYGSWNLKMNGVQKTTVISGGTLDLNAGSNVSLSYGAGGVITINATNTDTNTTYVAGDGISITGATNIITNTKPNVVQTLSGSGNTINLSNGGSHTIPAQSWGSITGKPATFPPDIHTHSQYLTQETDPTVPSHVKSISAGNINNWNKSLDASFLSEKFLNDANLITNGTQTNYLLALNQPSGTQDGSLFSLSYSDKYSNQQFHDWRNNEMFIRSKNGTNWSDWEKLWSYKDFAQANIINWNTAFDWGNHATAGYLTSSALSPYAQTSWVNANFDKYTAWNLQTNSVQRTSMPSGSNLNLVAGANVTISYSAGGTVTINAANSGVPANMVTTDTAQTISGVKTFSNNVTAPAFYEGSLKSLKKNIKTFKKSGLELIEELEIVTFDRKDESAKNKIGIIADDSPKEFLSEELDAVDLYKTVFIQAKAIQELSKELKDLRELILQNRP